VERLLGDGLEAEMVDPPPPEHRRLAVGLGVALDLEDVQLPAGPDVDEREAHARLLFDVARDRGVEHLLVEAVQALAVVGDDGDVVHTVEEHFGDCMRSSLSHHPTSPSTSSRMRSAWPLCRAYSSTMWV